MLLEIRDLWVHYGGPGPSGLEVGKIALKGEAAKIAKDECVTKGYLGYYN